MGVQVHVCPRQVTDGAYKSMIFQEIPLTLSYYDKRSTTYDNLLTSMLLYCAIYQEYSTCRCMQEMNMRDLTSSALYRLLVLQTCTEK